MRKVYTAFVLLFMAYNAAAQVGIGTETPSDAAQLEIVASDKGVLIPRVFLDSPTDATTITGGNEESLLVYNLSSAAQMRQGYYYWHDNRWRRLVSDSEVTENALTSLRHEGGQRLTYIDENGEETSLVLEESLTSLVYDGNGILTYTDEAGTANEIDLTTLFSESRSGAPVEAAAGENLQARDESVIVENGEGATLVETWLRVAEHGITTEKLAPGAVSPDKLSADAVDVGKVATVREDGSVSYEAIKAAMPKFFYMPSILVPVRERQVETRYDTQDRLGRINLYARYQDQFSNPMVSSENAEASIPTLPASELEYHVTYFDERVFEVERITAEGILHYTVKDAPITEMSFMNIVFVIK